jgi:hypothetical protein
MPREGATVFSDLIGKLECCGLSARNAGARGATGLPH